MRDVISNIEGLIILTKPQIIIGYLSRMEQGLQNNVTISHLKSQSYNLNGKRGFIYLVSAHPGHESGIRLSRPSPSAVPTQQPLQGLMGEG